MIRLATVSPCYNEEAVLTHSVERLSELLGRMAEAGQVSRDSLIVLVNDGSTDGTWDKIVQLHRQYPQVRGVNLARNVGHQSAIMAGMMCAREWADAVVTLDADLQDDIEAIPQMVERLEEGSEVVYGVKVQRQADSWAKRKSAEAFYHLQSSMGVRAVYNHADFRLMSRRALDMLADYKERNLYLRGLIPMLGLKSATVDDVISEREAGKSKYTLGKMLNLAVDGITSFSVKPIYGIIYLGLLFILVSIGIGVYVLHALLTGTAVPGWSSIILSIWLTGGFLMVALGTVGLYIGKIYQEVKQRPLYHIKEIL